MEPNQTQLDPAELNSEFAVYEELRFPFRLRVVASTLCALLMFIGFVGNVLVPYVVSKTRDLRNSTNYFLVNLSVADLILLIVCPPTAVVELNSRPEVWTLGEFMCKLQMHFKSRALEPFYSVNCMLKKLRSQKV